MNIDYIPLITYITITVLSPGPNNMLCLSLGIQDRYQNIIPFMLGILSGVLIVMLGCAFLSSLIISQFSSFENYLRLIGGCYIFWLAWLTFNTDYHLNKQANRSFSFTKGLLLQFINPKGIVYGLTLFTTFLSPLANHAHALILICIVLALFTFVANSFWALLGNRVSHYLANKRLKQYVNSILSLILAWIAIDLMRLI